MTRAAQITFGGLLIGSSVAFMPDMLPPDIPKWLCVFAAALAALGGTAILARKAWGGEVTLSGVDLAVAALAGYALLSIAWTPDPQGALYVAIKIGALLSVYAFVRLYLATSPDGHQKLFTTVCGALGAAALFICAVYPWTPDIYAALGWTTKDGITRDFVAAFFGNANFMTEFLLLASAWVLTAALWAETLLARLASFGVLAAIAVTLYVADPNLEIIALGFVGVILAASLFHLSGPKTTALLIGTGGAAGLAGWHFIPGLHQSMASRLDMWINSAYLWAEKPIFGHGLASFYGQYDKVQYEAMKSAPSLDYVNMLTPMHYAGHAHNVFVQAAAELGLIGLALLVWLVIEVWKARRARYVTAHEAPPRVASNLMLGIAVALMLVEFPEAMPYGAPLIAIALGVAATAAPGRVTFRKVKFYHVAPLGVAVAGAMIWIAPGMAQNARHMADTEFYFRANPLIALKSNAAAHRAFRLDQYTRRQLPQTVGAFVARYPNRVVMDKAAADTAWKIGLSAAPHSPAVIMARVEYLLNSGREKEPEIAELLDQLKTRQWWLAETWALDALYALRINDPERLFASTYRAIEQSPHIANSSPVFAKIVQFVRKEAQGHAKNSR